MSVYYSGYFSVPSYGDEKFKDYFSGALDISLFILAVYLIVVEYMDYNLQNHINKLEGKKNGKVDSLIEMDRFEKNVDRFEEKAGMIEKAVDNAVDRVTSTAKEMMLRAAEKTEETDDKNI